MSFGKGAAWLLLVFLFNNAHGVYRMCVYPHMDICKSLEQGNSNVSCYQVSDSVDCSIALASNKADFAVFKPEEAIIAKEKIDNFVKVIGEIRHKSKRTDPNFFEMVVLIRKSTVSSFQDLRNKKYCHPGIGMSHHFTDKFLKHFESVVVPKSCKSMFSSAEQEIFNINDFFGPSCRPGTWAQDDDFDYRLKRTYNKMCLLCDSQRDCMNNIQSSGSHEAALDCLTLKSGDVAFVSLSSVKKYFEDSSKSASLNYNFLCPNKTVMGLENPNPCVWAKQPWDLLVTRNDIAYELRMNFESWISSGRKTSADKWQDVLRAVILEENKEFVARDQAFPLRGVDDQESVCGKPIRWCTVNKLETEKCEWIRVAAMSHGIKPYIECVEGHGLINCLKYISTEAADVISIDSEQGYIARSIFNLSTVVFEDNTADGNYKILAVIKSDSNIKSFWDLKNKKACFPMYNGLGWVAFQDVARQKKLLGSMCPERFFSSACAPGAGLYNFTNPGRKVPSSMCSLCPDGTCFLNSTRAIKHYNALKCLSNGNDVAFVDYRRLKKEIEEQAKFDATKFSVLCKDGTIVQNTLTVDDSCALATGISAEVVGRSYSYGQYQEVVDMSELFLQLNAWFGTIGLHWEGPIQIFKKFRSHANIIFKESTIALVSPSDTNYHLINSYKDLMKNVDWKCSSSYRLVSSYFLVVITAYFALR